MEDYIVCITNKEEFLGLLPDIQKQNPRGNWNEEDYNTTTREEAYFWFGSEDGHCGDRYWIENEYPNWPIYSYSEWKNKQENNIIENFQIY